MQKPTEGQNNQGQNNQRDKKQGSAVKQNA